MNAISRLLLKAFINHKIKRFGKMTTIQIDSASKTIEFTAELAGETAPIAVRASYQIEQTEAGLAILPSNVTTSREWLTVLANEFLSSQVVRLPIPSGLPSAAVKVLRL